MPLKMTFLSMANTGVKILVGVIAGLLLGNKTNNRDKSRAISEEFHENKDTNETSNPIAENNFDKIQYAESIISKQLNLYTWCEEKVSTLATINAIMLTAATLFVEHVKKSDQIKIDLPCSIWKHIMFFIESNFHLIAILIMVLFISLGITLWHVIPKMRSGANPKAVRIHRSVTGIHKFRIL